jgi:hypothetical protein
MRTSKSRKFAACVAGAMALLGAGASAAAASPAVFSSTGAITLTSSGPSTFAIGTTPTPATTVTCPSLYIINANASNTGSPLQGSLAAIIYGLTCVDGYGQSAFVDLRLYPLNAVNTGGAFSLSGKVDYVTVNTNARTYGAVGSTIPIVAPWVNGCVCPPGPSKYTFSGAQLGPISGGPLTGQYIKFSGSFKATTTGGGPLTLS